MKVLIKLTLLLLYFDATQAAFLFPCSGDAKPQYARQTIQSSPHDFLLMVRKDSSEEIQSNEYGPTSSNKAKVAWDDASYHDIKNAFEMSELVSKGIPQDEKKYVNVVTDLSDMLSNVIEPSIGPIRSLITSLRDSEVYDPKMSKLGGSLPQAVADALAEAKAADDIYGPDSRKASDAWNVAEQTVMDINITGHASSPSSINEKTDMAQEQHPSLRYKESAMTHHHDYLAVVDPQSLEDAIQAMMKLEHLTRLLTIEKNRLSFSLQNKKHESSTDKKP